MERKANKLDTVAGPLIMDLLATVGLSGLEDRLFHSLVDDAPAGGRRVMMPITGGSSHVSAHSRRARFVV